MRTLLARLACTAGFTFVCFAKLAAQIVPDLIPPSPTAFSFAKVVDMPVNLYSGTPIVSIPIYSVKERTLSSEINLRYTGASGIKVQDVAGPASLGWTLEAGGVISRTVRGMPDEMPGKGYCMTNNTGLSADVTSSAFKTALQAGIMGSDMEPDIFTSNIGGRIVFSMNKRPSFVHEEGYYIKRNGLFSADSTWEILDTKGNVFLFGANAMEREHSGAVASSSYISSWYLSEIRSANGEVIRFSYEKGIAIGYQYYTKVKSTSITSISTKEEINEEGTNINIFDPVYLKEITTSNCKVAFSYVKRWDMIGQRAIEGITVNDRNGIVHAGFRFRNGYFSDGQSNPYARPKLLGVERCNSGLNKYVSIAEFYYNETATLPPRNSAEFDHWGYYNYNPSGKRLKSEGAVKTAHLDRCKAGTLRAIYWPTGGQTHYDYELNTYRRNGIDYTGGGLRIHKIRQVEATNVSETQYSYINSDNTSSGQLQISFNPDSGYVASSTFSFTAERMGSIEVITGEATTEYDLPMFQLVDLNGTAVGYSLVTITYPNQSKEKQFFQDYYSFPDLPRGVFLVDLGSFINVTTTYRPGWHGFFCFYSSNHQLRGLLKKRQMVNSVGAIVQETNYGYRLGALNGASPIAGVQKKPHFLYSAHNTESTLWSAALYYEIPFALQRTSEETVSFAEDLPGVENKLFSRNEYKGNYPFLVSKQIQSLSNGDSSVISYKYPLDFDVPQGITATMRQRNIIVPLEAIVKSKTANGELVKNATLNLYSQTGNWVLPSVINSLSVPEPVGDYQGLGISTPIDSRFETKMTYDLYAPSGELLQYHGVDNTPVSVFWGYRHTIPVAKVIGSSYAVASQFVDTAILNTGNLSDEQMRAELNKLRANLPNAFVTTYTHQPLLGVKTETDATGQTVYYEYDDFSRLRLIRDANSKIINQYEYYQQLAGGWRDTQVRRCIQDANGMYTGEEEVQQIDEDVNSSTYNQTRWRSLGYTAGCNKVIYAKMYLENIYRSSRMGNGRLVDVKLATVVVRFFEDQACTVPQYVRPIDVAYKMTVRPYGYGISNFSWQPGGVVRGSGNSLVLTQEAVIEEQNYPEDDPLWYAYDFSLASGAEYIVVP